MPDPAFARLVLARSVTTVDEGDDLEAKKAEASERHFKANPQDTGKAVEFTVRRLLCGFPVTEDGKMLTPDQLEECFPVMTDLQVSKAVEAFYAASGMEPTPVEDAWGKPDVSALMPHPSDATESKQNGSALPEEPPVNRDTETAVTPPQPDEYEQPR